MKRALVICGDVWHPAAVVRQGLEPLREAGFDFEFMEGNEMLSANRVDAYPLIVLARANVDGGEKPWMTAETQHVLPQHVRRGNGLVVLHGGTARYEELPLMNALMGGSFIHHPEPCDVTIEANGNESIVEDMLPFTVRDEHYFVKTRPDAEIFLRSRSQHGVQAAGWKRSEGEGRVCALTPGHNLDVWLHPAFQKILVNTFHWTGKDK